MVVNNDRSMNFQTFHVIIERTLITPSDPPKATSGASPPADRERNSILQQQIKVPMNSQTYTCEQGKKHMTNFDNR